MDFTLPLYFLFEEKFPSRFHWKLSPKFPAMSLTQPIFMEYLSLIAQLVKNPPAMQDYPSSIPGSGGYPGEGIGYPLQYTWASLVAQLVKNPLVMWETWVRSLGWENHLEKGKATHCSILAWRISRTV